VPWVVQHYIPLAGAGTNWDPDPIKVLTGEFAKDGQGNDLPLTSLKGGRAFADAHVVNAAGDHVNPANFGIDIAFAIRTEVEVKTSNGDPVTKYQWSRGPIAMGQAPGLLEVEQPIPSPTIGTVVVTGGNAVPASNRLAVRVWRE